MRNIVPLGRAHGLHSILKEAEQLDVGDTRSRERQMMHEELDELLVVHALCLGAHRKLGPRYDQNLLKDRKDVVGTDSLRLDAALHGAEQERQNVHDLGHVLLDRHEAPHNLPQPIDVLLKHLLDAAHLGVPLLDLALQVDREALTQARCNWLWKVLVNNHFDILEIVALHDSISN